MLLERTSTLSLQTSLRSSMQRIQVQLESAQVEVSTGRHSDVGLVLGGAVGRNINWRSEISRIDTLTRRLDYTSGRATASQAAIESVKSQTDNLRQVLLASRSALNGNELSRTAGENSLNGLLSTLSTSYGGEYLLSGRATDQKPLENYAGMGPQLAFDAAFLAEFGFNKSSPLASGITSAQVQTFVDGRFSDLFTDPAWSSDWSTADPVNLKVRLENGSEITSDANINEEAFKTALKTAVLAYEFGGTSIDRGTFQTVVDNIATQSSLAMEQLGEIQARIGHSQQTITQTSSRLTLKKGLLEESVTKSEGVSEFAAATRLNSLMTQLETSYAVTSRISKLSLLSYI